MKVIDLLNKIANGEEVPEKIIFDDTVYKVKHNDSIDRDYYIDDEDNVLLRQINDVFKLNKEVEIIEEDKKIPEKIDEEFFEAVSSSYRERIMKDKINEIIDYLEEKE